MTSLDYPTSDSVRQTPFDAAAFRSYEDLGEAPTEAAQCRAIGTL